MGNSLDTAIALLKTPLDHESYVSIKIKPSNKECCCFHCWPRTWEKINAYIFPCGPLEDEGSVLIEQEDAKFVLQCHESGPEIIIYLGLTTALIAITNSVIDLITTLVKARQNEHAKKVCKLTIAKRYQVKGKVEEEQIVEIEFPMLPDEAKKIRSSIKQAIGNSKNKHGKT